MENSFEKVKNWFESESKNDNCFYRLYTIKYANSNATRKDLRSTNFISSSIDESLNKLQNDINIHAQTSERFFLLNHISDKKDAHPISIVFENTFYDQAKNKVSGINGIYSTQNNDSNALLTLMKDHHTSSSQLREEILALRHEHTIEKMDNRIGELEESQKNSIDRLGEFFQTDVGQQIVTGITQLLSQKMTPNTTSVQPVQPVQPIRPIQPKKTIAEPKQDSRVNNLNESLQKLDSVFDGDGLNALNELAQYCLENPMIAKQLRTKTKENE
jgi:hypothetical protein